MTRRNEVMVGAVIVLGIAVIVTGTIWLKGRGFGQEEVALQARFREVGLLADGNPVRMRGVPVGVVEEIELEPNGEAVLVTMTVREGIEFPRDPVVVLSPKSMFGDWQAEIFPRSAFPQYDYAESADRDVLPGYALPDITRLTVVADQIARNLAVLSTRFSEAFTEETARNIREAIDNIQDVSASLTTMVDAQQKTVNEVGTNLAETSQSLGEAADVVKRAFAQIDTAMGTANLTEIGGNVRRSSARIDSLSREMVDASRQLRGTLDAADSAFTGVAEVTGAMRRGEGSLGRLLQDTALYESLVASNAELQLLLRDIRANPRKYINVRVF